MTATYFVRNSSVDYDIQGYSLKKELESTGMEALKPSSSVVELATRKRMRVEG